MKGMGWRVQGIVFQVIAFDFDLTPLVWLPKGGAFIIIDKSI